MFCSKVWSTPDQIAFQGHSSGMRATILPITAANGCESLRWNKVIGRPTISNSPQLSRGRPVRSPKRSNSWKPAGFEAWTRSFGWVTPV